MPRAFPVLLVLPALALLAVPRAALADPPANDARAAAQQLGALPADVRGTTVDATLDPDEPEGCGTTKGSVWYEFSTGAAREILVALDAAGDLDATVDVFKRERSEVTSVACKQTGRNGQA